MMENPRSQSAGVTPDLPVVTHAARMCAARIMAARDGRAYPSLTLAERKQYGNRADAAHDLVTELRETYDIMVDAIGAERADSALASLVNPVVADAFALDYVERKVRPRPDIVQGPAGNVREMSNPGRAAEAIERYNALPDNC